MKKINTFATSLMIGLFSTAVFANEVTTQPATQPAQTTVVTAPAPLQHPLLFSKLLSIRMPSTLTPHPPQKFKTNWLALVRKKPKLLLTTARKTVLS